MAKFQSDFISSTLIFFIFFGLLTQADLISLTSNDNVIKEIEVGVTVDMGSWIGKTIHACLSMAVSDFYKSNNHYRTRIVLHIRDSQGKSVRALSAVMDLTENNNVHAIIGLETYLEEKFLAILSEKAKIPIISFSPLITTSSSDHTYLVKIRSDETSQFEGIASIIKSFEWTKVILIFEGIKDDRKDSPHLEELFEGKNIQISYRSFISSTSKDYQIIKKLQKLRTMETNVYILDMSLPLASQFLMHAKKLGMINEKNNWIVTDKAMNSVHSMDFEVIESLQGTLGFKMNIGGSSSKIHNMTSRWITENPNVVSSELPVVGIWAYNAMLGLAEAFERVNKECSKANFQHFHGGMLLLDELSSIRFDEGLSSEFQLDIDGKLYPEEFKLTNFVQGNVENTLGVWRAKEGIFKEFMCLRNHSNYSNGIVCPMGKNSPRDRLLQGLSPKKLRVGVPVKHEFQEFVDVNRNNKTNERNVTGFCIDVFEAAIRYLPDPPLYEFIPILPRSSNYNDYIDQVYFQVFDALVGDFTITSNRSRYVDFTSAYTDIGLGMIARLDDDIWFFLRPFSPTLWIVTVIFFVLTALIVWYVEHPINEEFQGTRAWQIGTILFYAISILVYAHRERLRSNVSRFIVGVWLFVVFIIASSYTANLSSILTVKQIKLTKNYYVGYANPLVGELLVSNLMQDRKLNSFTSPAEYDEALRKGSKKGGVDAIIEEIPYLKVFLAQYSDDYQMIGTSKTTNGFAFVFQKGSPLVREMSIAIAKLREEGKLLDFENKWFRSDSPLLSQDKTDPSTFSAPESLSLTMFFGLFLFSGISKVVVVLLLLVIALYQRFLIGYYIGRLWASRRLIFFFRYLFPRNRMTDMKGRINAV